jgi:hypothetical protein
MVLASLVGRRPALGHGGGARSLPSAATTAAARATTCNMGRPGGSTSSVVAPPATSSQYTPPPLRYAPLVEVPAWVQHLWTPAPFVDLVSDDKEDGGA